MRSGPLLSASSLRQEISARNLARAAQGHIHEQSFGAVTSVLYVPQEDGLHGNFLPASYGRILADPDWCSRLRKAYTSAASIPRRHDRRRSELDCAASSDALLMNLFCYPGLLARPSVCALLGIAPGQRPAFGVRAMLPMADSRIDRTEIDMLLGDLLVEAKLTEGGFGVATRRQIERYTGACDLFDFDRLPRRGESYAGWQLLRGVLAAVHHDARFLVLCDGRRADLRELWFRVQAAVLSSALRSRLGLVTWQELSVAAPPRVRAFLAQKYGILGR